MNEINLTIDGIAVTVPKGTTVYNAAKKLGIDIPIFCYQDRMPPFGACRMCLVEVEKAPKLQASCTLECTEGMVVKTQSTPAVEGRKGIVELLLINHPLDCPICDKGGECPLQEQALSHGPGESRFFEEKRRFKKPLPLGPVLMLDRERCIICARCTRFGDLIAGDHALEFIERGYKTEVGTPSGGPAESKFIGNTITICPVGALTSQVYRFRARPWDNQPTESTCTLCPVGCSMILDSRDGEIMRTRAKENGQVNDMWLCDKGWFGYEFTSHPDRLKTPLMRQNGTLVPVSWEEAFSTLAKKMTEAKSGGKLAAFGGNPLTVEENYFFQKLMRDAAGVNHLDHRIGSPIQTLAEEGLPPGMETSMKECEELSYAVFLGLDLTEEFPLVWLRIKQALNRGAQLFFLGNFAPEIAPHLAKTLLHAPGQELEMLKKYLPELTSREGKGAIFVGSQYLASKQRGSILAHLAQFQSTHARLTLNIMEGRGNSGGARFAGMRPDMGPLGKQLVKPGLNALQVLESAVKNGWDFLYVAGANPARKFSSKLWNGARANLRFLVVQDLFLTETAQTADIVLPTLSFVEKGGTFLNIEGRFQKLRPGKELPVDIYSDADIFTLLAQKLSIPLSLDKVFLESLQETRLPLKREPFSATSSTSSPVDLAVCFSHALFDHGVRMQHNTHVAQLAKKPFVRLHPEDAAKRHLHNGAIVTISANGSSLVAPLKLDTQVAPGTAVLPLGFPELPVHELGLQGINGSPLEITSLS